MERATTRTKETQIKTKALSIRRTGATLTEEDRGRRLGAGLDNQHISMHKLAKLWSGQ